MNVTLLYFDGCPNWRTADEHLRVLESELDLSVERRQVDTAEEAERIGFGGSPTVLVEGRDPFADGDESVGLSCRIYQTPSGTASAPTLAQLRSVLTALDQA